MLWFAQNCRRENVLNVKSTASELSLHKDMRCWTLQSPNMGGFLLDKPLVFAHYARNLTCHMFPQFSVGVFC